MSDPAESPKYLTRKTLIEFVRTLNGVPLSESRVDKDGHKGVLRPDATFGRRHLYTEETAAKYARRLIEPLA